MVLEVSPSPARGPVDEGRLSPDRVPPAALLANQIRDAKLEGTAYRQWTSDPTEQAWVPRAVDAWERRVGRLIDAAAPPRTRSLWTRSALVATADGVPLDYAPGALGWWIEHRIDRRLVELERISEALSSSP